MSDPIKLYTLESCGRIAEAADWQFVRKSDHLAALAAAEVLGRNKEREFSITLINEIIQESCSSDQDRSKMGAIAKRIAREIRSSRV